MASNQTNIVYVTRDVERGLGRVPGDNYHIITNSTPYAEEIKKLYPMHVLLVDSEEILDTYELLLRPEVQEIITNFNAQVLVFKNTTNIESLCKEKNWKLLNPSAELSEKIENKITQVEWLSELSSLLPPHKVVTVKDIVWEKKPFILQWSHGHTGDGTILVANEKQLDEIKSKFPHRDARITDFIKGPMFTVNIVVTDTVILLGNISYQITGILPFTENAFSTIGNDWSVPHTILSEGQIEEFNAIAQKVAIKMQKSNWRGLFGIDVIYDEERNNLHLIEINARQPASTTYESQLQNMVNMHGVPGISCFDAHLSVLTGVPISSSLIPINDGAQILQRVTTNVKEVDASKLVSAGYNVIKYSNTKPNKDLCRIQSKLGIMETHTKFNSRGKDIIELLN
jgi:predicted ATP-grasp superfamily ATP-dependent carboligase